MQIYDILKKDHQKLMQVFDKIEKTNENQVERRRDLIGEVRDVLVPHARAEERVLYDVLKDIEMTEDMALEAWEEHKQAEMLLREIQVANPSDKQWMAKVAVLRESLEHHIEEEEGEMFEKARQLLTDGEADMMGEAFKELKAEVKDGSIVQSALSKVAEFMPDRFASRFRDMSRNI